MSRATVRAAVKARLDDGLAEGNLPGLATIYRAFPRVIPGEAFAGPNRPQGSGWGVVAVINLIESREQRVASGDPLGWKRIDYTLELQFFLRWSRTDDDGQGATDALDDFIDDVKAWIRADRTAASDDVWQWGEAELTDRVGEPLATDAAIEVWGAVRTEVTEFFQA